MATKINKSEMDAIVRDGAIAALGIAEAGTQIGTSTYAIPVETPAEILVAQIFTIPLRNSLVSRLETVIPTNGMKIR